ncbi:hypothetical protein E4U41_005655 [Claviceps citrina]|nr:hypothetical protein E4U41_005655 [Claviceps citrina]
MLAMRLLGPAAAITGTGAVTGTPTPRAVSCRTCVKQKRHHFRAAIGGRDADVRNSFSTANGFGQTNSGSAPNTDDNVSVVYARNSVVDNMGRYVDHGRVEDAGVEIRNEALDPARKRYSGRAGHNEWCGDAQAAKLTSGCGESVGVVFDDTDDDPPGDFRLLRPEAVEDELLR